MALDWPAATALAACEPQGLDGVAVGLGEAMKAEVVTRWRERSGTPSARVHEPGAQPLAGLEYVAR